MDKLPSRPRPSFTLVLQTDPGIRVPGNLVLKLGLGRTCESRFCGQGALRPAAPAGDARAGRRRCPPDQTRTPGGGGACGARWRRPRSCVRSRGCWPPPGCRAAVSVSSGPFGPRPTPPQHEPSWNLRRRRRRRLRRRPSCRDLHRPRPEFSTPHHRPSALLQTATWPLRGFGVFLPPARQMCPGNNTRGLPLILPPPEPVRPGDTLTRR